MESYMGVMQKIEKAAMLLREAACELEETDLIKLDYEIKIKPIPPPLDYLNFCRTNPGENLSPSK